MICTEIKRNEERFYWSISVNGEVVAAGHDQSLKDAVRNSNQKSLQILLRLMTSR